MKDSGSKLRKVLDTLSELETGEKGREGISPLMLTITSIGFIGVLLSLPLTDLRGMLFMWAYLAIASPWLGIDYGRIFRRSLFVLPFIAFIGIFNPIIDKAPGMTVGDFTVSRGWLSFVCIIVRGLLSVQMILLLTSVAGFRGVCAALSRMKMPAFLVSQLLMVFRYIGVLIEETLTMQRARLARGYGRKMTLGMWGTFVGQLFVRSVRRAENVHKAMLSRGFTGVIPLRDMDCKGRGKQDIAFVSLSFLIFILIRIWA